jgi:hypothetical protein
MSVICVVGQAEFRCWADGAVVLGWWSLLLGKLSGGVELEELWC